MIVILALTPRLYATINIQNLTQLKAAASVSGTYTIKPGTYTLDEDLVFGTSITITHNGLPGDVIINGDWAYSVIFDDDGTATTSTMSGLNDDKRIIFTKTYGSTVSIRSSAAAVTVTFNYCDFTKSYLSNGFTVTNTDAASMNVTCNNCRAFDNFNDGFSLSGTTGVENVHTLTLNSCKAYDNGYDGITASGDGATCHNSKHILIINGGEYYSNGKSGVATAGGKVYCYGGTYFHDNGDMSQGVCDVFVDDFGLFDGAVFDNDNIGTTRMYCEFYGSGTTGILTNCVFKPLNVNTGVETQVLLFNCKFLMTNCVFYGAQGATCCIFTGTDTTGLISNCTFYGNYIGIRLRSSRLALVNNISGFSAYGVYADSGCYSNNSFNGYNCWYNNWSNLGSDGGSIASTDIKADPQFVDAAGGDFRLEPNSPCLNAGKPTLYGGFTDIGAWQGESFVRYLPPNCTEPLAMDFNDDCKVNVQDLAIFGQSWLECNLDPPETCWE